MAAKGNKTAALFEHKNGKITEKGLSDLNKMFTQYCKHLENGYSKRSFVPCSFETMEKYIKDYSNVLDSKQMLKAKRGNLFFWEDIGIRGTTGAIKGFNAKSWDMNMKNRFGWADKQDHKHDVEVKHTVEEVKKLLGESVVEIKEIPEQLT